MAVKDFISVVWVRTSVNALPIGTLLGNKSSVTSETRTWTARLRALHFSAWSHMVTLVTIRPIP